MGYKLIDHTADVGIEAKGENLEQAFRETAKGMFSIICDLDKVEGIGEYKIELSEHDWEDLLVSFLSELIYLHEVEDVLFSDFDITLKQNKEKTIIAHAKGEELDLDKHRLETAIKGVSYHDLQIDEDGKIRIIFDV